MSSGSSSRRRLSDSQLHRDRANLLPDLESSSSSVTAEHRGAFERIGKQLELEGKLHELAQQLLQSYRETQQWASVGQLAQVLVAGSQRVGQLKQQLQSLRLNSGGLFLESIRERSLPRDTPEAEAANQSNPDQSLKKVDTVEAESSAEGAYKIPARQDSPENVGQFEQASEQRRLVEQCANSRQIDQVEEEDSLVSTVSTTAALPVLPAAQVPVEPKGANQNPEEAAGESVKFAYQLESESLDSEFVLADSGEDSEAKSLSGEGRLDAAVEESQQLVIYSEEKDNADLNSSGVCSTSGDTPSTPPPNFEDATVDAPPLAVDIDTTADRTDSKLETESAKEEIGNKETSQDIVPLTCESNKSQNSRSPSPTFPETNKQTELIGDFNHVVVEEVPTASSLKPPEASEEATVETTPSSEHSESESGSLLSSTPPTLPPVGQAPLNTDHQHTVDTGETLLHVLSPGETQSNTTDGLETTTSVSSIDRDFGIVDECLVELTSEIEALVITSEISSETSEQFFSPPESIIVEPEYDDAQQELEIEEAIKPDDQESTLRENTETVEPTVFVNPALVDKEEVVEDKEETPTILTEPIVVQGQEEEKPVVLTELVPSLLGEEGEPVVPTVVVSEVTLLEGVEKPAVPVESVVSLEVQVEEHVIPAALAEPAVVKVQEQVVEEIEQNPAIDAKPVQQEQEKLADPAVVVIQDQEERKEVKPILVADQGEILCEEEIGETNVKPVVPIEPVVTLKEDQVVGDAVVKEKKTADVTPETETEEPKVAIVQIEWDTNLCPEVAEINEFAPTENKEGGGEIVSSLATETAVESVAAESQRRVEMEPLPKIGCPAVRYSIARSAFSDDNKLGTALYLIRPVMDKNGDTQSAVSPSETIAHCFEDFLELRRKLLSLEQLSDGEKAPKTIPELEHDSFLKENGQMVGNDGLGEELHSSNKEKILEEFLNQVASNPQLHREPVVLNFLSPTPNEALPSTVASASEDILNSISSQVNGGEKREPAVEVEENDVVKSDRAASVDETPTEQGMYICLCVCVVGKVLDSMCLFAGTLKQIDAGCGTCTCTCI